MGWGFVVKVSFSTHLPTSRSALTCPTVRNVFGFCSVTVFIRIRLACIFVAVFDGTVLAMVMLVLRICLPQEPAWRQVVSLDWECRSRCGNSIQEAWSQTYQEPDRAGESTRQDVGKNHEGIEEPHFLQRLPSFRRTLLCEPCIGGSCSLHAREPFAPYPNAASDLCTALLPDPITQ